MTAEEEILEIPEAVEAPKPKRPRNVKPPSADAEPLPKKPRGKSGQKKKKRREPKKKMTASDISQQFYGLHQLLATVARDPALAVTQESADSVGVAAYDVIEEYDLWWLFELAPIVGLILALLTAEVPILLHVIGGKKGDNGGAGRTTNADPRPRSILREPPSVFIAPGPIVTDPVTVVHAADGADDAISNGN